VSPGEEPRFARTVAPTRTSSPAQPIEPDAPALPAPIPRVDAPAESGSLAVAGMAVATAPEVIAALRPGASATDLADKRQTTEPGLEALRDASDPSPTKPAAVDLASPSEPLAERRRSGSSEDGDTWKHPPAPSSVDAERARPELPAPAVTLDHVHPTLPSERPLAILAPPLNEPERGDARGHREEPPVVRVTIGRIEVRAPPPEPARVEATDPPAVDAPRLSLDDYLERRKAGWG
jgi:hypothetical protein